MSTALVAAFEGVVHWLLLSGWQAMVIACFVLSLSWALRERLHATWRFCLWLVVLGRLSIPILPAAPWGIFSRSVSNETYAANSPPLNYVSPVSINAATEVSRSTIPLVVEKEPSVNEVLDTTSTSKATKSLDRRGWSWTANFGLIWLVGVLAFTVRFVMTARAFARKRCNWNEASDAEINELFEACKLELGVTRHVSLRIARENIGPATCGVFFPEVVLPEQLLARVSSNDLRLILLHELVHVNRWDVLFEHWATAVAILHWFHPLGWFARRCLQNERELACDSAVLRHVQLSEVGNYGHVVLKTIEISRIGSIAPGLVGIFSRLPSSLLERRIHNIANYQRRPAIHWWLGGTIALVAMLVGWTNAQVQEAKKPISANVSVISKPRGAMAGQLVGQVIDATTLEPLPNASLTLHQLLNHGTVRKVVLQELSSDENGSFQFDAIPEFANESGKGTDLLLSVRFAGKSSHIRFITEPEQMAKPLTIALTMPVIVEGHVVNDRGEPISGAKVFFGGFRNDPFPGDVFCATTDDEGRYAIQDLGERPERNSPEARYFFGNEIRAQHPNYYQQSAQRYGNTRQINWKMSKAGSLMGRVLDSSNNNPAANVSVVAYIPFPDGNSERINYLVEHKAVTDAQGRYNFSGLKPDKYNVIVSLPDCATEAVKLIDVEPERIAQAPDMVLSDECWIEGEVVNAKTGEPVPYCFESTNPIIVEIEGASHPKESGITPTIAVDKEGKFRARVAPGRAFVSIGAGNFRFVGSETSGGITVNRISHLRDFLVDKDLHRRGVVVKPHETVKVRLQLDVPDDKQPGSGVSQNGNK